MEKYSNLQSTLNATALAVEGAIFAPSAFKASSWARVLEIGKDAK